MIATVFLAAQYAGTFDLSDTTRVATRATRPAPIVFAPSPGQDVLSADLSTAAAARLGLRGRRAELTLTYSPTITAPSVELGLEPLVVNAAGTTMGWHDRFARVTVSETAVYGRVNSALLNQPTVGPPAGTGAASGSTGTSGGPSTATTVQSAPAPATIAFGSSTTTGAMTLAPSRRFALAVAGGYFVTGGLTTDAQRILPRQYGPLASASLTYLASHRDTSVSAFTIRETTTSGACVPGLQPASASPVPPTSTGSCVTDAAIVQIAETLRHDLSAVAFVAVTAGVAASLVPATALAQQELVVQPVVGSTYAERLGTNGRSEFTASAVLAPSIDVRTGLPIQRVQTLFALSKEIDPKVIVRGSAGLLQSVPIPRADPFPLTTLNAGLEGLVHADRQVDIGLGYLLFWQSQSGYGTQASHNLYLSVTARLPTLHF